MSAHGKITEAVEELRVAQRELGKMIEKVKAGFVLQTDAVGHLEKIDDKIFNAISHLGD
jgi:hypothetical protein